MSSLFVQNLARAYRASVLNQDLKQPFLTSYHIITRSKTFVQPLVPNFKSPRLLNQLSSTLGNYWLEASPRERSCKVEPSAVVKIEPKAKKVNSKPKPKPKSSRKRKKNRSKVKSQQVSPVAPVVSPALAVAPNPPIEVVQVHLVPEVAADIPIAASPANSDDANQEDEDAEEHASQLIVELFGGTFSSSLDAITFRTAGFDTHNNVGTTRFHGSANEYEQEGLEFRKKLEVCIF